MQRPDVRQRLLDGCKKRPSISKEAREKAALSNTGKRHSLAAKQLLSEKKKAYYYNFHKRLADEFDYNLEMIN